VKPDPSLGLIARDGIAMPTKIDPRIKGRGVLVYKNDDNNKIYTNHKIIFKKIKQNKM